MRLLLVDAADGQIAWQRNLGVVQTSAAKTRRPAHWTDGRTVASMISCSGGVYGADTSGVLYAFDPPGRRGSCSPTCFPAYRQRP